VVRWKSACYTKKSSCVCLADWKDPRIEEWSGVTDHIEKPGEGDRAEVDDSSLI